MRTVRGTSLTLTGLALLACMPASSDETQAATRDGQAAQPADALATAVAEQAPPTTPAPPAPPPPPPEPEYDHWLDAPQTPGDWQYLPSGAGGSALYAEPGGAPSLILRCNRTLASVTIIRAGHAIESQPIRIVTETAERMLNGSPNFAQPPAVEASVAARDPLLDAMALSKGRFMVEVGGQRTLYVPAWPEVSRVVEDCR